MLDLKAAELRLDASGGLVRKLISTCVSALEPHIISGREGTSGGNGEQIGMKGCGVDNEDGIEEVGNWTSATAQCSIGGMSWGLVSMAGRSTSWARSDSKGSQIVNLRSAKSRLLMKPNCEILNFC